MNTTNDNHKTNFAPQCEVTEMLGKSRKSRRNAEKGRVIKHIPIELIDAALSLGANHAQLQHVLENAGYYVTIKQIDNAVKRHAKMPFSEYRNRKMDGIRLKLIQKALTMAMAGNVPVLIFTLKNLCNWTDRQTNVNETAEPFIIERRDGTRLIMGNRDAQRLQALDADVTQAVHDVDVSTGDD
jgi:hypothetical protein